MLKKIFFLFFFAGSLSAQELAYEVKLHPVEINKITRETHKVQVFVNFKKLKINTNIVTYQMPIWAPGAYSVTHYGHYVSNFEAYDRQLRTLPVKQIDGDRWEISNGKNLWSISYFVSDSHMDSTSLFFALANIDTNFFFANGTCLFGYINDKKNIPSTITYNVPSSWKLATALDTVSTSLWNEENNKYYELTPTNSFTFKARNYDELADAPVMAGTDFQTRKFQDGKAWYDIVVASDKPFPMDSLEENTRQIVHAETEFFHDTPFDHYTFLIYAPTYSKSFSSGQGALEHANSSAYLLVNLPWSTFKQFGPAIISHEFFHLWNVKRIHSSLLGPFDYTKRVMTTSLWLSEGITDYYAHTILTRWNILPYRSFETVLGELMYGVKNSKAANTKSLEELSIAESDFDLTNALVFYSKGTLVGLMLDIEIRSRTNNNKSLDDVMLALNDDAKNGKTFQDSELIGKMEKIAGLDLHDFYKKYIIGTDTLPIETYLKKMGVGWSVVHHQDINMDLGFNPTGNSGNTEPILKNGTPQNNLKLDDKSLRIDNHQNKLTLPRPNGVITFGPLPDATPLEVAIRHGIVGEDY